MKMDKEIFIRLNSDGYVIGGYVSKISASKKLLESPNDTKMVKVKITDDDLLNENEAIETIKKFNEDNK